MNHNEISRGEKRFLRRELIKWYIQANYFAHIEKERGKRLSTFKYNVRRCVRDSEIRLYKQELRLS